MIRKAGCPKKNHAQTTDEYFEPPVVGNHRLRELSRTCDKSA
jgi:hypothetical protein